MKKNEVKFMLQASIDSDYATIDSSARIEFELFKFTVKGALLEIEGYSTVKNLHSYTEDRIRRILLLRPRSEEHTSELQSRGHLVCRLLLEKKKNNLYK